MSKVLEFFGINTRQENLEWNTILTEQKCPYTQQKCFKVRKSMSDVSIGTCTVEYGKDNKNIMICPNRLINKNKIFMDCIHLLSLHEPGNDLHVVSEVTIPGGSVDYFLVSVHDNKVIDFVGIELQTLDTTGTVWPERQRLLNELGFEVDEKDINSKKTFGMNWKMTAKTILVQMHHKAETFEHINKHLVLILQDYLLDYMKKEFVFNHLSNAKLGHAIHIHPYALVEKNDEFTLDLKRRISTDSEGMAKCLGLQTEAKVELTEIIKILEAKIGENTLLTI